MRVHAEERTMATDKPQNTRPLFATLVASAPAAQRGRALGFIGSTVFHIGLVACLAWATMAVGQEVDEREQVSIIELAQETPPPPPPPPPPQEVKLQPAAEPIARGYQEIVLPTIVPPYIPAPQIGVRFNAKDFSGEGVRGGVHDGDSTVTKTRNDVTDRPGFTPMTVAPELTNTADVQRALVRSYPPLLRDAGIGGKPVVWFLIDETGKVIKTQLSQSSGHAALDEAAMRVAEIMKFSPALNHDKKVTVWVELPIVFRVN
jgi:protein TonB